MARAIDLEALAGNAGVLVIAQRLLQAPQLKGCRHQRFAIGLGEVFELVAQSFDFDSQAMQCVRW